MRVKYVLLLLLWILPAHAQVAADKVDQIRKELFNPASGKVLVAAHRGDWRNACENSLEAIENAVQMGVDIVEVDLARTKDGHLILLHDNTLDRTTTGKGNRKNIRWLK